MCEEKPIRRLSPPIGSGHQRLPRQSVARVVNAHVGGADDNEPFLRLIKKWLKAGVLDTDGKVLRPESGTPQGGIISPVLANVYLHYVLDLWFERVVQRSCKGGAFLHRYADDFVCGFGRAEEAQRFYNELEERLRKFELELAQDKTRVMPFSR